ncbi:MAG: PAS domain-containing sensor histidine kinase [Alphaproteobacteria bacterium]|nr:PAS domain-containing sensor histidine kinase [Alphaproteobacteria bacterium]
MDSRILMGGSFAFAMTWRTVLAAGLIFLLLQVLTGTQYYATALVLAVLFVLTVADTARLYVRDRTSLIPARMALPRDEARQRDEMTALLDAVSVALVSLSSDGRITLVNRAARRLAGEDVGRLEDMRILDRQAAGLIGALPAGARQVVTLKDGRSLLVWVAAFSAPGALARRLLSLQVVAGELDAVQLKAWQDMTRVLSHEMMNSLTPIASLSESLLMQFVDRYRQIAELPAPRLRPVPLGPFLADMDALAGADLAARGIAYGGDRSGTTHVFHADPELLTQALLNLLHNAADAVAGRDGPTVMLDCHAGAERLAFSIRDNGPGVSPDRLQEIFVPFYTTKANGSGIGLTLARQIALAHGGQVTPRANAESGMTFTLDVPLRRA